DPPPYQCTATPTGSMSVRTPRGERAPQSALVDHLLATGPTSVLEQMSVQPTRRFAGYRHRGVGDVACLSAIGHLRVELSPHLGDLAHCCLQQVTRSAVGS